MAHEIGLRHGKLVATISAMGAEILSLRQAEIGEFIWQASSESWRRQSPVLFSIIGRYPAGLVTIAGVPLNLPPHGFAPYTEFVVTESSTVACTLDLSSTAATLVVYPFHFRLSVRHELHDNGLLSVFTVTNP